MIYLRNIFMKMLKNLKATGLGMLILMTVFACKPRAELNYLKDIEQVAVETSLKNSRSTIQPGDQLIITVTARDMDVVRPFNQAYSSSANVVQYSSPSSNSQQQVMPVAGPTYIVDTDGNISFPVIGKISTAGLNQEEFRDKIRGMLTRYIKDPVVDLKITNYKVTVLGEVTRPGTYVIPDGNVTVLSALGLAGDLTMYGVRQNVLVVRNIDGEISKQRIDLTSANFINSPVYYLKQNDVVYVESNETKQKTARLDPNTGIYISVASIVIGLLALLIK